MLTENELHHKLSRALRTPLKYLSEPLALFGTEKTVKFKAQISLTEKDQVIVLLLPNEIRKRLPQRTWDWLYKQCWNHFEERGLLE